LNGTAQSEETGNFDDKMELFINPDPTKPEPTATLVRQEASEKDIYRWGSTKPFGSARALVLRGSVVGNFPDYYIDGIRVALTWEDVMDYNPTGVKNVLANANQNKKMIMDGKMVIMKNGVRYNVLGTQL